MKKKENNQQSIKITDSQNIQIGKVSINTKKEPDHSGKEVVAGHTLKEKVVHQVSEGNIRNGLSLLAESLNKEEDKYDQAMLLLGRLNHIEIEESNGTSSNAEIRKELNSIRKSTISLVKGIE